MAEITLESLASRMKVVEEKLGVIPATPDWKSVVGNSVRNEFTDLMEQEMARLEQEDFDNTIENMFMESDEHLDAVDGLEATYKIVLNFFNGNRDKAMRWLVTPAAAFDGEKPWKVLRQPDGFDRVTSLIYRVEYGVYS